VPTGSRLDVAIDEKRIDAIFSGLDGCHLPGATVGIAQGGRPVYRKGFGLASMDLPVVLTPTIRMPIGSTTKHFTCLAYMLLCEEGKARLDDTIGKHMPELHPVTHAVTMRQLMGHLGGLRDAYEICMLFSGVERRISLTEALSLYRDIDDSNAAPGTAWIYNNGGYLILSAIIERLAGRALADVLREWIFERAGMGQTLLRRFDCGFVSNSAALHRGNERAGFEKGLRSIEGAGQGGIVSTVDDMLRWLAHMDRPVVGNERTWQLMKAPQALATGASTGYGLGLRTERYRGIETLSHAGGVLGGNSQMLKVPAVGLDIAVMLNRQDVSAISLVNVILDAFLQGLRLPEPIPQTPLVAGTFRSPHTGRVAQLFAQNGEQILSIDGTDMRVVANVDGVFSAAPPHSAACQSMMLGGDRQRPDSIRFSHFGSPDMLIAAPPVHDVSARVIAGLYRSITTGTDVTISDDGSLVTRGRFGSMVYRLEPVAEGVWRARSASPVPLGGVLSFGGDAGGFRFSNGRTRGLIFTKDAGAAHARHRVR
jgi:D-aminopeptidase